MADETLNRVAALLSQPIIAAAGAFSPAEAVATFIAVRDELKKQTAPSRGGARQVKVIGL